METGLKRQNYGAGKGRRALERARQEVTWVGPDDVSQGTAAVNECHLQGRDQGPRSLPKFLC